MGTFRMIKGGGGGKGGVLTSAIITIPPTEAGGQEGALLSLGNGFHQSLDQDNESPLRAGMAQSAKIHLSLFIFQ